MVTKIMPFSIEAAGCTHPGRRRRHNEDFWGQLPTHQFYVIADGMGGHKAGEVASREAVQSLCRLFGEALEQRGAAALSIRKQKELLASLIYEVNTMLFQRGMEDDDLRGMGTTLCFVYFLNDTAILGHVGDSRIYRLRGGKLERMTRDHSLMRELVEMGQLEEEDVEEFLYKNIITRSIGCDPIVEPTIEKTDVVEGDVFMMCTDGLTDMLPDKDIAELLVRKLGEDDTTVDEVARALVSRANARGGEDNVTVVLTHVASSNE